MKKSIATALSPHSTNHVKTSTHSTAPVELARLLEWTEKEKSKAFDEWLKEPPNKNAPSAQYHISRWETMRDVVKKIKSEIKNASKGTSL